YLQPDRYGAWRHSCQHGLFRNSRRHVKPPFLGCSCTLGQHHSVFLGCAWFTHDAQSTQARRHRQKGPTGTQPARRLNRWGPSTFSARIRPPLTAPEHQTTERHLLIRDRDKRNYGPPKEDGGPNQAQTDRGVLPKWPRNESNDLCRGARKVLAPMPRAKT